MSALASNAKIVALRLLAVAALLAIPALHFASDEHERDEHEHADEVRGAHGERDEDAAGAFTVADFEAAGVRLATAGPGEVDVGVELPGEVRPNADRIAHLRPRFPGIVREVRRQIGDRVRAGEVLAVIESENLARYDLTVAFDGAVIDKHISPGETVTRDDTAFIVADLSTVWVSIDIYQNALPQVRVGQPVVLSASHGALEATGTVAYITPVVDQATRTASARVVLPNPDGAWRPGLYVNATIYNPAAAAIVVPRRAVQTLAQSPVVFVAEGNRFEPRAVTLGRTGRSRVEVSTGLSAGERFADERSFLVKAELAKGEAGHAHEH